MFNGCMQNQCIDMAIVFSFVHESRHPPWSGFLDEFGNLQEHNSRIFWVYFNMTQKLMKEHPEEILSVEMPGIFITIMDEINIGQWSSGQVGEDVWRSQEIFVVPRRSGTRRRTDWIRVDKFDKIFFFARSRTTWRQRTSSQQTSRTG